MALVGASRLVGAAGAIRPRAALAALILTSAASMAATAQVANPRSTMPSASDEPKQDTGQLEQVTVTARYTNENLQTTPVAITAVTGEQLQELLVEDLPDYMIPTAWVKLDRLPLSPNGKLERSTLPKPEPVVVPVGDAPVGAGRRQPNDSVDVPGRQPHAVLHLGGPVRVVPAAAGFAIEQPAAYVREIGARGIVGVLELHQAAAPAAVAEALPLGIRHFRQ